MGTQADALAHVDADRAIALTRRWVEVNSYTANIAGVNQVGAMLRDAFALPSLTCETIPGGDGYGDHLIWRTKAPGKPIVLVGPPRHRVPPGHFEGCRDEAGARRPRRARHEGRARVVALRARGARAAGARRPPGARSSSSPTKRSARPRARRYLARARTARRRARLRGGPRGRRVVTRRKGIGPSTSPRTARRPTPATPTGTARTRSGRCRSSSTARSGSPITRAASP